ncbi:MAG: NosD domain-containing protein [Thermoleophilia bacterium]
MQYFGVPKAGINDINAENGVRWRAFLLLVLVSVPLIYFSLAVPARAVITTYTISDNASGGSCTSIGTWDAATKTCTLTADLPNSSIILGSNSVTLDGNGYILSGNGSGSGVSASGKSSVGVKNLRVTGFATGINLGSGTTWSSLYGNVIWGNTADGILISGSTTNGNVAGGNEISANGASGINVSGSNNNTLSDNLVSNNLVNYGITLQSSTGDTLTGNILSGNRYNFGVYGGQDQHYTHNINTTNLADGKPIYYITGASGQTFDSTTNAGAFYCINCDNVTIDGISPSKSYAGIFLYKTTNSHIINSNPTYDYYGIWAISSSGNTFSDNFCTNDFRGMGFSFSNGNLLSGNSASNNEEDGIWLNNSGNTITGNTVSSNGEKGIELFTSTGNTLAANIMWANKYNLGAADSSRPVSPSIFSNTVDSTNTVDGKPVFVLKDVTGGIWDSSTNAGLFYCSNCNGVTVKDLTFSHNGAGVLLNNSTYSLIENVSASDNLSGAEILNSGSNTISGGSFSNNSKGIETGGAGPASAPIGNTIKGATMDHNSYSGVTLHSDNNTVMRNTISDNGSHGVDIYYGDYNTVVNNNLINNGISVFYYYSYVPTGNVFSLPAPYGGNYWSGHTGPDGNNDGFVDTPVSFYPGQDSLPWTTLNGWQGLPEPSGDLLSPAISNILPASKIYVNATTVTASYNDIIPSSGIDLSSATIKVNGGSPVACTAAGSPAGSISCSVSGLLNGLNHVELSIADIAGNTGTASGTFEADLGPIILLDNATGGDCTAIGAWDGATKTCTMNTGLSMKQIIIQADNITLDGNGKTIEGYVVNGPNVPASNLSFGVQMVGRTGDTVRNLRLESCYSCIVINSSSGISIVNNYIGGTVLYIAGMRPDYGTGIYLTNSHDNLISGNTVLGDGPQPGINTLPMVTGEIFLSSSNNNLFTGNTVGNGAYGFWISDSDSNTFKGNTVKENVYAGIFLFGGSTTNTVYQNSFLNNTGQARDDAGGNAFNIDAPNGGNYWSDWTAPDGNHDGFVDNPYVFSGGQDNLPWAAQTGWSVLAPGKPALSLRNPVPYWASYADYILGKLSVDMTLANVGANNAYGAQISSCGNNNGVNLLTPLPLSLGDIRAGGSVSATLSYDIPQGVTSWRSVVGVSALDADLNPYTYP